MSTQPTYKTLLVDLKDRVCVVTLNRPRRKNAFNHDMYIEVASVLRWAAKNDDIMCLVLTGAGDFYSSGNDLSVFSSMAPDDLQKSLRDARDMLVDFVGSFIDFPKILIAALNGPALGIAATTLGLCDLVYAVESATINTPFMELGQSPEGCSSLTFPLLMGFHNATKMLLLGRKFSAKEASKAGLVTSVVSAENLMTKVFKVANKFAAHPPNGLMHSKRLIREEWIPRLHATNQRECDRLVERWGSDECMNAIAQWMMKAAEKRRKRKQKARL
mmetsp:Transcript_47671/g.120014  ORF Transcript_47671/g.120014 Transcript_47671/m.120014 type:complete len:274 (-) Transcript_47671:146-967(-)